MSAPLILTEIDTTRSWVREQQRHGRSVGFVPTMGALHQGHLSLALAAKADCDVVIASVFVNPTQFAPGEDYERYPRDLAADAEMLAGVGVTAVFAPSVETMYPAGSETLIDVGSVARDFEGESRPKHFAGVATVVAKLFSIVPADRAYFGRKDYQQTVVIRRMVADLNLPTEVVICPIVREPNGLAMSSRNAYLSASERHHAAALSQGLGEAKRLHAEGERRVEVLREAVRAIVDKTPNVELEYIAIMPDGAIDQPEEITGPAVVAIAARVGKTRLIDNALLD